MDKNNTLTQLADKLATEEELEELEAQRLEDEKERDAYYSQQYHELRHADYESEEEEE